MRRNRERGPDPDTSIAARDGYALAATVFTPAAAPSRAVLINSAAAVPRNIYRGFAAYLAEQGCAVVTYDYRGIGFTGTAAERIDIRPDDAGAARIGHFGFFRPEHRDTLWRDAAKWLVR
jgi:predicted alpha/beta hydrolase